MFMDSDICTNHFRTLNVELAMWKRFHKGRGDRAVTQDREQTATRKEVGSIGASCQKNLKSKTLLKFGERELVAFVISDLKFITRLKWGLVL